jgi:hypothetical protein
MDLRRWLRRERSITITTVAGCPNDCAYCPQQAFLDAYRKRGGPRLLSLDDFDYYLEKIPQEVKIIFGGFCEPWGNKHCTEMLLQAHRNGHSIDVYTTLVGMTAKDVQLIKDIPFESTFVVHLPDGNGMSKISPNEGYVEVLKALTAAKIKDLYFVIQQYGKEEVVLSKEVARVLPPDQVHTINCHTWGGLVGEIMAKNGRSSRWFGPCPRFYRNVLLPNGDVALCCWDMGLKHIIGNLKESDYEGLFQSAEFKRIKSGFRKKDPSLLCSHCDTPLRQLLALSVPPAYRPFVKHSIRGCRRMFHYVLRLPRLLGEGNNSRG